MGTALLALCCAVVDGSANDEPLHCRAERYCGRATLSSRG